MIYDINWIYKLGLRRYRAEDQYKKWLSSLLSTQEKKGFKGLIKLIHIIKEIIVLDFG